MVTLCPHAFGLHQLNPVGYKEKQNKTNMSVRVGRQILVGLREDRGEDGGEDRWT